MVQLRLFRDRRFSAASASIALAFFALFGALFFLTQYLQLVLGYSALQAGIRTVPVAAGLVLGSAVSAPANNRRLGTKLIVIVGMLLAAGGLLVLTGAVPASGYSRVLAALLLAGTGIGVAMAPATDSVMGSLAGLLPWPGKAGGAVRFSATRRSARCRLPGRRALAPGHCSSEPARPPSAGSMASAGEPAHCRRLAAALTPARRGPDTRSARSLSRSPKGQREVSARAAPG
ncbi:MAG: MFS transporter [Actinomycetota bacterium]|nr:MFS transporter [Actinomycetota bacterium]